MARKNRPGQNPRPRKEQEQWKIRYWADLVDNNGRHQRVRKTACLGSTTTTTYAEACQKARRILQPINDLAEGVEYRGRTVQELIDRWRVTLKPALKPSSQAAYEWGLARVAAAWGSAPVQHVGRPEVQEFITAASQGGLASASVAALRRFARILFGVAEEWGWIGRGTNPAGGRSIRLPHHQAVRARHILTPEAFWRVLAALQPPHCTLVKIGALAGLRRGELAALRWIDNAEPGVLVVDETYSARALGTPKSERSRRRVPISRVCQAALEEWRRAARWTEPADFIFRHRDAARRPGQHGTGHPPHSRGLQTGRSRVDLLARSPAHLHDLGARRGGGPRDDARPAGPFAGGHDLLVQPLAGRRCSRADRGVRNEENDVRPNPWIFALGGAFAALLAVLAVAASITWLKRSRRRSQAIRQGLLSYFFLLTLCRIFGHRWRVLVPDTCGFGCLFECRWCKELRLERSKTTGKLILLSLGRREADP